MIVSYKDAGSPGGWTTLCDESAGSDLLTEFEPSVVPVVQQEPLYGSDNQFREGRGNTVCTLPMDFRTQYASRAAALASVATFTASLVDTKVHLRFVQDATTIYLPNAMATSYKPKLTGVSVQHVFSWEADKPTTTAP